MTEYVEAETLTALAPKAMPEINSPSYYTRFPHEVIDFTECLNFNRGNAVKYIARAGHKPDSDELTDLHKAEWYIKREIARVTRERNADAIGRINA